MFALFLLGMIAAHLVAADLLGRFFRSAAGSVAATAALIAIAALFGKLGSTSIAWTDYPLLLVAFLAIAHDSRGFAFLRWPSTRMLGTTSYSVYLMHGIVLFVAFAAVNRYVSVASLSSYGFWCLTCCCGVIVVLGSAVTYRYIEYPFLSIKN